MNRSCSGGPSPTTLCRHDAVLILPLEREETSARRSRDDPLLGRAEATARGGSRVGAPRPTGGRAKAGSGHMEAGGGCAEAIARGGRRVGARRPEIADCSCRGGREVAGERGEAEDLG
jgi:hypothetical protein